MVLVVDPQIAGISGDMFLCALVDLGADKKAIIDGVMDSTRFLDGASINSMSFKPTVRKGTSAIELNVDIYDNFKDASTGVGHHVSRKGTDIARAIKHASSSLGLSDAALDYASCCIETLLDSESRVHGVGVNSVILHETSHADTLVDVIGSAIALDDLGLFGQRVVCLPVCVGSGFVEFSHGTVSNPAGAILQVFKKHGLVMHGSPAGCELTTPTGACMLAALGPDSVEFYPRMGVDSVGYGAGTLNSKQFANVLKLVRGVEEHADSVYGRCCGDGNADTTAATTVVTKPRDRHIEHVCVLETNVDDVSGEVLGGLVERMMGAGAKDVTICPGITKKNRPTNLISVMCDKSKSDMLVDLLVSETGTLGVRISDSERIVIPRRQYEANVMVSGETFTVRYKRNGVGYDNKYAHLDGDASTGYGSGDNTRDDCGIGTVCNDHNGHPLAFKIEFDDVQSVSEKLHMPIRDAELILRDRIEKIIADGDARNTVGVDGRNSNDSGGDGGGTA